MISHLLISDANNGNVIPPRSPSRTTDDEYDYQMNNFSLIKAQLKASNSHLLFEINQHIKKKLLYFVSTTSILFGNNHQNSSFL